MDNQFGNWPLANRQVNAALKYMRYDCEFVLGDGQHNSKHGASIFPDAMKWLWREAKQEGSFGTWFSSSS